MAKPRNVIQLSFKNEGDEYELFTFLKTKLNASAFIKETLWDLYKYNQVSSNFAPITKMDVGPKVLPIQEDVQEETAQEQEEDLFVEEEERLCDDF